MPKINIQGEEDVIDPFYRYKMEKMIVGKQKNKTIVTNIDKVAADIYVQPELIAEYFKHSLSTNVKLSGSELTINGKFEYEQLFDVLKKFVDVMVLCPECGKPELDIYVDNDTVASRCKACPEVSVHNVGDKLNRKFCKIIESNPLNKKTLDGF